MASKARMPWLNKTRPPAPPVRWGGRSGSKTERVKTKAAETAQSGGVRVRVSKADTGTTIAKAVADAINSSPSMPFTATAEQNFLMLDAKCKKGLGNGSARIQLREGGEG